MDMQRMRPAGLVSPAEQPKGSAEDTELCAAGGGEESREEKTQLHSREEITNSFTGAAAPEEMEGRDGGFICATGNREERCHHPGRVGQEQ